MLATPLIPSIAPNAVAAPTAAPSPPAGHDDANGFARQLEQAHQSNASAPAQKPTPDDNAQAKPDKKVAKKADGPHADDADKAAGPDAAKTSDPNQPADLASLLAGLMPAQTARTAPPAASTAKGADAAAAVAGADGRKSAPAGRADAKAGTKAGSGGEVALGSAKSTDVAGGLTQDTKAQAEAAQAQVRPEALAAAQSPALHAAQAVADSATRSIGAPIQAQVAAPLGSPEFAPALGAQVSVLVRDGVQEARLQLNPAEMGPITVQIHLDGSNAQVNMAAEHHQTRQALEQAMPSLAGALRENGLTLTGGGVFEQPRQPRDGRDAAASGSGRPALAGATGDDPDVTGLVARPATGPARGVVDLYA